MYVVKCGTGDIKRLGSPVGLSSTFCSVTELFSTTVTSEMFPEPLLPPFSPDEAPPRKTSGSQLLVTAKKTALLYWEQSGLPQNLLALVFFLAGENLSTSVLPSFRCSRLPCISPLSRLNLSCSLFTLSSTSFSRSLYHPGSTLQTHLNLPVGFQWDPVLQIRIEFSHSLIAPGFTWGFPSFVCYWLA